MILVEILRKIRYNKLNKEKNMSKDWQRGSGYVDAPKIEKELGVGKDGYQTGGVDITKDVPNPTESQIVEVRGTKRMRADKKPVKATWY
tara:strand:- start:31 stop:297 length:267 start_codon:yes stop_codon:yes gene_type:complete